MLRQRYRRTESYADEQHAPSAGIRSRAAARAANAEPVGGEGARASKRDRGGMHRRRQVVAAHKYLRLRKAPSAAVVTVAQINQLPAVRASEYARVLVEIRAIGVVPNNEVHNPGHGSRGNDPHVVGAP